MKSINLARDHRTPDVKFIALGSLASLAVAYWAWVRFSYLFVPFRPLPYENQLKIWRLDGYYKVWPGTYENPKYGTVFTIMQILDAGQVASHPVHAGASGFTPCVLRASAQRAWPRAGCTPERRARASRLERRT